MKTEPTEAGDMLYKFAEMRGWNKNKLIGWSEAADFADWFANQSSPKIKQLEWGCEGFHHTDGSLPNEICASTPFGAKYYIYHLWGTVFQLTYGYRTISFYLDHGVEDVKAAAQADFEKRVMECLDYD